MSPVQGLEQRRVHITSAVCSESRSLPKTFDGRHVTADKPDTRCSSELTHLSRRRSVGPAVALDESTSRLPLVPVELGAYLSAVVAFESELDKAKATSRVM